MASQLASFRHAFARAVVESQGLSDDWVEKVEQDLEKPREGNRGDLALPCFKMAKELGEKNPVAFAGKVAEGLAQDPRWASVEAVKAFVNVTFLTQEIAAAVVPEARKAGYGGSESGRGKTVVIDFSSPNIAKPLAFHHIRSTVIGAALTRLYAACGWEVRGINYLGDWGKQFGLLATGFQRHGDPARRDDAKHLVEVYVKSNAEADVGSVKAAIAGPENRRKLEEELAKAKDAMGDEPSKKQKKKLEKLEKKLASMPDLDELEKKKADAEARLPSVEARDAEARAFLKKMEAQDPEAKAEWKEFRDTSIADFKRVYARMGVEFHAIEGESRYQDVLEETVARVREKPGTTISEGAEVVDLPYKEGEPPIILKTGVGTTLYITRDIAAAMERHERFAFERSLYVVGQDQKLHFEQLKRTLDAMGFDWAARINHVGFGRVAGMSTRKGNVVFLDEVLDEAVAKAREKCEASEKIDKSRLDETSEAIGVGAIMFGDLKSDRLTNYTFDFDAILEFSGESGPNVQFSHARCCSIIAKGGGVPEEADISLLTLAEERPVIMALAEYPEVVERACDENDPSAVTRAVLDLAKVTASYLTSGNKDRSKRVLQEEDAALRAARLVLIDAVRNTLAHGLNLLGVKAPSAM